MIEGLTRRGALLAGAGLAVAACSPKGGESATAAGAAAATTLTNVSYDPTRELYRAYNAWFIADQKSKGGGAALDIKQSHGGSGSQALSVIGGLEADVVTLGLAYDIDSIAQKAKAIAPDWQARLPDNSTPYTSTIVFLVRKGNPKGVKDWGDLVKPGVQIITPNPKTSGGARWNYLAAWEWGRRNKGGEAGAKDFIRTLYANVPVLDSGARGATNTFAQRGLGDVLLAWENEAYLALKEQGGDKFEIVTPPFSVLAEPPVAVVDRVVDKRGTRKLAEDYLKGLYTPAAQDIIAQNFYRPRDPDVAARTASQFPKLELFTIADIGGWAKTHAAHFADGGVFDEVYRPKA